MAIFHVVVKINTDTGPKFELLMGDKIVLEVLKLMVFSCNKYYLANCKFTKVTFF